MIVASGSTAVRVKVKGGYPASQPAFIVYVNGGGINPVAIVSGGELESANTTLSSKFEYIVRTTG
jgi:hypothetical protein